MTDSLERTLYSLRFDVPAGLVDRAQAAAARGTGDGPRRRGVWIRRPAVLTTAVAAFLVLVVAANGVAAYFAPAYGQALADVPILGSVAGPVLRFSGLEANHVSSLADSATSSGHIIRLVGAYADTERTVLLVEVDGQSHPVPNKQQSCCYVEGFLTDQFGHVYRPGGAYSPDGLAPSFEPLVPPASKVGARLTLHVTGLQPVGPGFQAATGDWELHLTLIQQAGVVVRLPSPVAAKGITYTFTSAHLSGLQLHVNYELSGTLVDQLRSLVNSSQAPLVQGSPPPAAVGSEAFAMLYDQPTMADAVGNTAQMLEWGMSLPKQGASAAEFTAVLPGHGRYVLTLGRAPGLPTVQIDVP